MAPKPTTTKSVRAQWTSDDTALLLLVLSENQNSHQSDSGWKSSVWTIAARRLSEQGSVKGGVKMAEKCEYHWGNVCTLIYSSSMISNMLPSSKVATAMCTTFVHAQDPAGIRANSCPLHQRAHGKIWSLLRCVTTSFAFSN